ncbi:MAG: type II secretion system F family protein [Bacteroidota bacterium]
MKGIEIPQISTPLSVSTRQKAVPKKDSIWHRDLAFGKAVSLKDKRNLYQMLGTLLSSGLGIMDAMEVLLDQVDKKMLRSILDRVKLDLVAGIPLSHALEKESVVFTPFEIHSLKMGEQTGSMPQILEGLGQLFDKRIQLKRKVMQALSYPMAVIIVALLVLGFMIAFVVPMFEDIFSRFDAELPSITQAILKISAIFTQHIGYILLGIGAISLGIFHIRKQARVRRLGASLLLKIPLIGKLFLKLQLSRLCYTFAMLLKASVNLDRALELLEPIVSFYPLQKATKQIRSAVIGGSTLYAAVSAHNIFPPFFTQIIKVGEKTAQLDHMLARLGENLEEESESGIAQLTQFLEPMLIIILGLMVAIILVAMYLPMFALSNAMG